MQDLVWLHPLSLDGRLQSSDRSPEGVNRSPLRLGYRSSVHWAYSGVVLVEHAAESSELVGVIRRSFQTALLLAGSIAAAEAALMDSIRAREIGDDDSALLSGVIEAAVARSVAPRAEVSRVLPIELQRVLRLPQILRHCFVLKILERWPSEACARVLGIDSREVEDHACLAASELVRITTRELVAVESS